MIAAITLSPVIANAELAPKKIHNNESTAPLSSKRSTQEIAEDLCVETVKNPKGKTERTAEQIRCNFDRNGAALSNIYQKALLQNPELEGSVIFNLVIEPSGLVISADPIESNVGNDTLIMDLRSKIMTFNFPDQKVEKWSGKHTLNFFKYY